MSAIDTHPESLDDDADTLQSKQVWKAAAKEELDFESQRLRNRLRAKMFGVDASPISIGRFTVLETVGSGGMGVVYAAYDQELDRRVAVKLLRGSREDDASVGKGRLLREAQALAKLSHPNVVQVYEVGTFDDRVFLAMEFLSGPTLRDWLLDTPRPWQDVLRVFAEAGRGLAAAHREDIIHRDFKPANVLFGSDERVRVVDFGLARATGQITTESPTEPSTGPSPEGGLTQTGEILGTPAYMSPEQARHESIDARSDQYSFCVALYEGLFGRRPHSGRGTAELLMAVSEGIVDAPPRSTKVPTRIVRAVMRGLSADPEARFPTMDALLAELTMEPRGHWRLLGVGTVMSASLAAYLVALGGGADCEAPDALASAWGPEERAAIEERFEGSGAHGSDEAAQLVLERIDAYAAQWSAARHDACEAHEVRHEQSAELYDRRMACLLERRAELGELTRSLSSADAPPDARMVQLAPQAVAELSAVSQCEELERVRADGPEHDDLRLRLAEAQAQYKLGAYGTALTGIEAVAVDARKAGALVVEARAQHHRGVVQERRRAYDEATEAYIRATELAEQTGRDDLAASSWVRLAHMHVQAGRRERARTSLRVAQSKIDRIGGDDELDASLVESRAYLASTEGRHEQAIAEQSAAVERRRMLADGARTGDATTKLADAIIRLANFLGEAGEHDLAQARYVEARPIVEQEYGREHPRLAQLMVEIAVDRQHAGQLDEATEAFLEAEAMLEASLGPHAPSLVLVEKALAQLARKRGDLDEAERRSLRLLELCDGEGVPQDHRLDALAQLGMIASMREDHEVALGHFRAFLDAARQDGVREDYVEAALFTQVNVAETLASLGRHQEAAAEARRVMPRLEGDERYAKLREVAASLIDSGSTPPSEGV